MIEGRHDEALKENQRKRDLDPLWPGSFGAGAQILYLARRYDRGMELARKALQLDPNFSAVHATLGLLYEQQARLAEAIEEFQSTLKGDPGSSVGLASLAHVYAVAGQAQEAERLLRQLQQNTGRGYTSAYQVAAVYAGLRQTDQAIAWLNNAVGDRDPWVRWLKGDPRFDEMRADPRVAELLHRLGLPP